MTFFIKNNQKIITFSPPQIYHPFYTSQNTTNHKTPQNPNRQKLPFCIRKNEAKSRFMPKPTQMVVFQYSTTSFWPLFWPSFPLSSPMIGTPKTDLFWPQKVQIWHYPQKEPFLTQKKLFFDHFPNFYRFYDILQYRILPDFSIKIPSFCRWDRPKINVKTLSYKKDESSRKPAYYSVKNSLSTGVF